MQGFVVAVVGATGAVGHEMLRVLEERAFPVRELRALASERSAGKKVRFHGEDIPVRTLREDSFAGVEVALFSAGADRSRQFAPHAVRAGALVVDNSSAFRMQPDVPLVVPEVNPHALRTHQGLIANPNCSTIQMVVALQPLRTLFGLRRIVVATYQSVSGAGNRAIAELEHTSRQVLDAQTPTASVLPRPIAFDCIPQVDVFEASGATREEVKMREETRRIFDDPRLSVLATCVRVPVFRSHSEAVVAEARQPVDLAVLREALRGAPGVELCDSPERYPVARQATGHDAVFVGRLRQDPDDLHTIAMWVVSDNLRKGAATNAVQIAALVHGIATTEVRA